MSLAHFLQDFSKTLLAIFKPQNEQNTATKKTLSTLTTIFTLFVYSVSSFALNPTFFHAVIDNNDPSILSTCLPIAAGVTCLALLYQAVCTVTARRSGIQLGTHMPLPSFVLGTYGCVTPLRSFPKSRSDLFDLAVVPPLVTAAVSLILIVFGFTLTLSTQTPLNHLK